MSKEVGAGGRFDIFLDYVNTCIFMQNFSGLSKIENPD